MREIKFKMWNKEEQKMYEVGKIDFQKERAYMTNWWGSTQSFFPFSMVEILQYTGLRDKNGIEICEGDILTNGDKNIKYIVKWVDTGLNARQYNNQSYIGLSYWQDKLEIIGNIYENSELLGGK